MNLRTNNIRDVKNERRHTKEIDPKIKRIGHFMGFEVLIDITANDTGHPDDVILIMAERFITDAFEHRELLDRIKTALK